MAPYNSTLKIQRLSETDHVPAAGISILNKIYYGYMALVGLTAGALLVVAPQTADGFVKPWFWILIAVAAFDAIIFFVLRRPPNETITMPTRMIGFAIGAILVLGITTFNGSTVRLF